MARTRPTVKRLAHAPQKQPTPDAVVGRGPWARSAWRAYGDGISTDLRSVLSASSVSATVWSGSTRTVTSWEPVGGLGQRRRTRRGTAPPDTPPAAERAGYGRTRTLSPSSDSATAFIGSTTTYAPVAMALVSGTITDAVCSVAMPCIGPIH